MIKSDWIVGARLDYEARHSLVISRRSRPQLGGHGCARTRSRAAARDFNTCERSFISSVTNAR